MGLQPSSACVVGTGRQCQEFLDGDLYNVNEEGDFSAMDVYQYNALANERIDPWSTMDDDLGPPCQLRPSRNAMLMEDALILDAHADPIQAMKPESLRFASSSSTSGVVICRNSRAAVFGDEMVIVKLRSTDVESTPTLSCSLEWDGAGCVAFGVVPHACASESMNLCRGRFLLSNGSASICNQDIDKHHKAWQAFEDISVTVDAAERRIRWFRNGEEQPEIDFSGNFDVARFNFAVLGQGCATVKLRKRGALQERPEANAQEAM
eukprot:TRINITY_DN16546_c0_g1_i2.p1 TRINITY_DN16546_c0_g1~~TRINITY_DN16546_c0_g1_i2.p1  ORF type:complete len:281 (-),score=47.00 TRINITY_DN16546_c0_g1_i2:51-845(-)